MLPRKNTGCSRESWAAGANASANPVPRSAAQVNHPLRGGGDHDGVGYRLPGAEPARQQYERVGTVPNSGQDGLDRMVSRFPGLQFRARGLSPTARMGFPGIVSASPAVPGVAFHYPGAVRSPV